MFAGGGGNNTCRRGLPRPGGKLPSSAREPPFPRRPSRRARVVTAVAGGLRGRRRDHVLVGHPDPGGLLRSHRERGTQRSRHRRGRFLRRVDVPWRRRARHRRGLRGGARHRSRHPGRRPRRVRPGGPRGRRRRGAGLGRPVRGPAELAGQGGRGRGGRGRRPAGDAHRRRLPVRHRGRGVLGGRPAVRRRHGRRHRGGLRRHVRGDDGRLRGHARPSRRSGSTCSRPRPAWCSRSRTPAEPRRPPGVRPGRR